MTTHGIKGAPAQHQKGSAMRHRCESFRRDIDQLQALVDDAVSNLMNVFAVITELAHAGAGELKDGTQPLVKAEGYARLAERIENEARRAVVYLQFHDLLSQSLGNLRSRVDQLQDAADATQGEEARRGALDRCEMLEARKPSTVRDMASGDIELF